MTMSESMKQCYDLLEKTGRVYGVTIDHFNEDIRDAQCVHYVCLRAADTIEDDMTLPVDVKKTMLNSFDKYLLDVTWKYSQSNDEHAIVLEQFPCATQALRELPSKYRSIILELIPQVGQNMAAFVGKEFITIEEINKYCELVSGVFCVGIARLFVAAGLETDLQDDSLIVQSSLLLQKTNLLRDFRKDWQCGRLYTAKDVWSKYVNSPGDFLKPENFDKGVEFVNELVTDVLQYAIPYLRIFNSLRSPSCIKYFGMNQVMAIATLELCYNNPRVFTELVKLERRDSAEIMQSASTFTGVMDKLGYYTERIKQRACQAKGPTQGTVDICQQILHEIELIKSNKASVASLYD